MSGSEQFLSSSHSLAFGTYEEAKAWIGRKSETYVVDVPIDESRSKYFCTLPEDGNPSYWDRPWADRHWGGLIAPPGLLISLILPLQWQPGGKREAGMIAFKIPLPGDMLINTGTDTEFYRPVYVGDRISIVDEVTSISEQKTTRLGSGHFITTDACFYTSVGELVARNRNMLYRYKVSEAAS